MLWDCAPGPVGSGWRVWQRVARHIVVLLDSLTECLQLLLELSQASVSVIRNPGRQN